MAEEAIKFECVVSADLFARALLGVSKEETRYYLNGVHVSPALNGGAVLTATDGSMLVSFHDPNAYIEGEAIVCLEKPMKQALPVSGILIEKRLLAVRVFESGKGRGFVLDQPRQPPGDDTPQEVAARTVFDDPDRRVKAAQFGPIFIDGKFPDWRRVVPTELAPSAPLPVLDEQRLSTIRQALCVKRSGCLQMTPTGDGTASNPIFIRATSGMIEGFGILMPGHHDAKPAAVPEWARAPQVAEAA